MSNSIEDSIEEWTKQMENEVEKILNEVKQRVKTFTVNVGVHRWCPYDCKNFKIQEDIDTYSKDGTLISVFRSYTCCNMSICQELRKNLKGD